MKLGELPPGSVVMFESQSVEYTIMPPEAKTAYINAGPEDVKLRFPEPGIGEDVANARASEDCEMAESMVNYSSGFSYYRGWVVYNPRKEQLLT